MRIKKKKLCCVCKTENIKYAALIDIFESFLMVRLFLKGIWLLSDAANLHF